MNGQSVPVLVDVTVYLGTIVLKIVGGIQRDIFLPVKNRVSEFCNDGFLSGFSFVQELD